VSRTWIERVKVGRYFGDDIDRWKAMKREGWDLTVLIAPDHLTVVAFGYQRDSV
jgi:hypothetical protein